jgi:hypothetical protein
MAWGVNEEPDPQNRLRRINIPTPNIELAAWLKGPECRAHVENITSQIFSYYYNSLPQSPLDPRVPGSGQRNLKNGADMKVELGGWGNDRDRWFGWITNDAMSYRKSIGQPYSRVIEYGGGKNNIPPGHQLQRAADFVARRVSSGDIGIPGIQHEPAGRGSTLRGGRGRFVANPLARDVKKSK